MIVPTAAVDSSKKLSDIMFVLNSISKLENYLKEDKNLELNLMIISIYNLITPEQLYYLDIRFIIALNMRIELLNTSMGFSGNFKQETSNANRNVKKVAELEQTRTLKKLLIQAKNTEFDTFHSFKETFNSADPVNMYKAYVPLNHTMESTITGSSIQ
jgi:hypothetical protein